MPDQGIQLHPSKLSITPFPIQPTKIANCWAKTSLLVLYDCRCPVTTSVNRIRRDKPGRQGWKDRHHWQSKRAVGWGLESETHYYSRQPQLTSTEASVCLDVQAPCTGPGTRDPETAKHATAVHTC